MNVLVQIGEALGPGGSLAVLLVLGGGGVWLTWAVRSNREDHRRLESKVDDLRKETREEFKSIREEFNQSRKETREDIP